MIQPQEIRIGNYYQGASRGNIEIVSWQTLRDLSEGKLNLLPIPLTEEILLKFGLKKIDDNLWQYKNGYLIGFYTKKWFIGKYNFDDMVEMITYFYYAHQLQNLYFALTGKELAF